MTDVASEIEVRRQADAAGAAAPNGNGASEPSAAEEAAVQSPATAAVAGESGESAVGESAVGESAVGESAVGESAVGGSAVGGSAVGGSAVGGSAVGGSAVGGSKAGGSAVGGSKVGGPEVAKDRPADRVSDAVDRVGDQVDKAVEQVNEVVERASDAVERAAAASGRVASAVVERLRNNAELAVERGTTSIADEVVEKIAGIAVREVPGVYDIGGDVARVLAGLKERIGLGDADDETDRGMRVRLEGRTAQVNVTLVIEYGFVVHSVAEKVRTKVISAIENLLGLEVTEVNILVDDVHVPDDARSV